MQQRHVTVCLCRYSVDAMLGLFSTGHKAWMGAACAELGVRSMSDHVCTAVTVLVSLDKDTPANV